MNTIYQIERRAPGAWINRAIRHLGREADNDTLQAISILLAALREATS
jgi:hypothetical protein